MQQVRNFAFYPTAATIPLDLVAGVFVVINAAIGRVAIFAAVRAQAATIAFVTFAHRDARKPAVR